MYFDIVKKNRCLCLFALCFTVFMIMSIAAWGETVITFAHYWPPALEDGLKAVTDNYTKNHPDVTVEYRFIDYGNFATKFLVESSAGTAADINLIEQSWQGLIFAEGLAEPLDSYIKKNPEKWQIDRFFPGVLESLGQYKGQQLGMPHIVEQECVALNVDILKKAGIEIPGYDLTWEGLINIAKKVHNPKDKIYGFNSQINTFLRDETPRVGIPWIKEGKPNFLSPEMINIGKWWEENIQPYDSPVDLKEPFLSGQVAIELTGICRTLGLVGLNFDWVVRPLPMVNGEDIALNITNTLMVNKDSQNKDIAVDILAYLVSDEGYLIYSQNGVQGTFGAKGEALNLVLTPMDKPPFDSIQKTFIHAKRSVSFPIEPWTFDVSAAMFKDYLTVKAKQMSVETYLENINYALQRGLDKYK